MFAFSIFNQFHVGESHATPGIAEPRAPSFFDTLVEDNLRPRYVQNISSMGYYDRLEELAGFFRGQCWMHMHKELRGLGITFHELGHRGREAALDSLEAQRFLREEASTELGHRGRDGALASLEAQGFSREEASTELGHRGRDGTLASLEAQGYTGEGGTRTASTEFGHRGRDGTLASLEAQGYTGEGGTRSASTELGRRGGVTYSAIYRISGNCEYPGCTYAINSSGLCVHHCTKKPEKSDKCKVCGWGPREIPRKKKDGVFFGQFLPQVQIPADHPRGDEIRRAANFLRAQPAYKDRSDYIEHRIWILVGMDPSQVTHHAEAIAKCPTIRLGVSDECFTYCNPGASMNECPSFRATHACSDGFPPTGIDYGNGLRFCVTNARIICRSKNGHCHIWTVAEGKMMAGILIVYIRVLISWGITSVIFNLGGTRASVAFFVAFDVELGTLLPAQRAFVRVEKAGTHVSNFDWRRPTVWSMPEYQIETVSQSAKDTGRFLRRFFL